MDRNDGADPPVGGIPDVPGFPVGYFTGPNRESDFIRNLQHITQTNIYAEGGVRPNLFVFDLEDLKNVMEQIIAFEGVYSYKARHYTCPVFTALVVRQIKNQVFYYFRRDSTKEPADRKLSLEVRLALLERVLQEIEVMRYDVETLLIKEATYFAPEYRDPNQMAK